MFNSDIALTYTNRTAKLKSVDTDVFAYSNPYVPDSIASFSGIKQHFKTAKFQSFRLSINAPNNCVLLSDGSTAIIQSFVVLTNNEKHIICNIFKNISDFYKRPCTSSLLGIYDFNGPCKEAITVRVDSIVKKRCR